MAKATRTVTVANREGFHVRAATQFVCLAQRFNSSIEVSKGDRRADGKSSALHMLSLGAIEGDQMLLQAEGHDAEEALDALAALFTIHFGEDDISNNMKNGLRRVSEGVGEDGSA